MTDCKNVLNCPNSTLSSGRRRQPSPPPEATNPTRSLINKYHASINAEPSSTYRPTEAQLRWAHLNRVTRVKETKALVDRLMQHPAHVSDVEGAHSSDGDSTVVDLDDENDCNYVAWGGSPTIASKSEAYDLKNCRSPAQTPSMSRSTNSSAYVGTRRDPRTGQWVRRHVSQKRFPHLAAKLGSASSSPSSATRGAKNGNSEPNDSPELYKGNKVKKKKVAISKGRRALLRVSARAYEERKKNNPWVRKLECAGTTEPDCMQQNQPYLSHCCDPSMSAVCQTPHRKGRKKKIKHKVVFETTPDLESIEKNTKGRERNVPRTRTLEDEISGLFTARTGETDSKSSSSIRRRRSPCSSQISSYSFISTEDEERIRRFEQAYRAIMLASDANNDVDDEFTVSTEWMNSGGKRWTRDPNVLSAVSIDGRSYDDLQRTPTVSLKQMKTSPDCYNAKNGISRFELCDRGASWLVHVPRPIPRNARVESGLGLIHDKIVRDEGDGALCVEKVTAYISRGRSKEKSHTSYRNVFLSPCQKKLCDIESKIHSSENTEKFDLTQNRKAILASRSQMDKTSKQPPIDPKKFLGHPPLGNTTTNSLEANDIGIQKTLLKSPTHTSKSERSVLLSDSISGEVDAKSGFRKKSARDILAMKGKMIKKGNCNAFSNQQPKLMIKVSTTMNPGSQLRTHSSRDSENTIDSPGNSVTIKVANNIDTSPVVRASTLRLLYSGIQSNKSQSIEKIASPKNFPTANGKDKPGSGNNGNQTTRNNCNINSNLADPFRNHTSNESIFEVPVEATTPIHRHCESFEKLEVSNFNTDGATKKIEHAVEHSQQSTIRPEPPENHNQCKKDNLINDDPPNELSQDQTNDWTRHDSERTSMEYHEMLPQLNIADLVRASLATQRLRLDPSIIDTDGTESDITGFGEEQRMAKVESLLLSPSLITRRFKQALHSIEQRNWDQLSYLINANPWLMEMTDVRTEQYLVHSLALHGGEQNDGEDGDGVGNNPIPVSNDLVRDMIDHFPSVVHKLDNEGNLPLHMAAASSNIAMIKELKHRFPGAASVQNHDGLLPLHLSVMSCALFSAGEEAVRLILEMFPESVYVKDNDGNTPLHIVAGTLRGDIGVEIIYQLTSACIEVARNSPIVLKENFGNAKKPKVLDDDASALTSTTELTTDFSNRGDVPPSSCFCTTKNSKGETPLTRAIKSSAGWQVIEALLNVDTANSAALDKNSASQNALHLALDSTFCDAAVILSILKSAPSSASVADGCGNLPIQLASKNSLQNEILLAIAIIDLPIDLGTKEEAIMRSGYGRSWWFLLCESNDKYVNIVKEILSLCSHPQKMALCLTKSGNRTAVASATPLCQLELRKSLRFMGRFEFVGGEKSSRKKSNHTKEFDALDYYALPDRGKKVTLLCYVDIMDYEDDHKHLLRSSIDSAFVEELDHFNVTELDDNAPHGVPLKYCVSIEKAKMTLAQVVGGMPRNHEYRNNTDLLARYYGKVKSVMRQVCKALSHLHENGIVHGCVDSLHVGKFLETWKITGIIGSVAIGENLRLDRLGLHSPPEAFIRPSPRVTGSIENEDTPLRMMLRAEPTVDVWAFGKLLYEVIVGESLFSIFLDHVDETTSAKFVSRWSTDCLDIISNELLEAGIGSSGVELIVSCLAPTKEDRPATNWVVLQHPFWSDKNSFTLP
ncbi:hypothetical protein ACHAXS_011265 [Conticribra weissflogii]